MHFFFCSQLFAWVTRIHGRHCVVPRQGQVANLRGTRRPHLGCQPCESSNPPASCLSSLPRIAPGGALPRTPHVTGRRDASPSRTLLPLVGSSLEACNPPLLAFHTLTNISRPRTGRRASNLGRGAPVPSFGFHSQTFFSPSSLADTIFRTDESWWILRTSLPGRGLPSPPVLKASMSKVLPASALRSSGGLPWEGPRPKGDERYTTTS
mmetsp:Transcript_23045/g.37521  ORF Transcript_23045/g.37521 Transcript_23045/m.37521 type:complete len:209 (+) Transcript_23045:103-729(+)